MKKILAIDDQKDNLITIGAVIKANIQNCIVLKAQSGKEGIEIAEQEQPDTILLDIIMPEIKGIDQTYSNYSHNSYKNRCVEPY